MIHTSSARRSSPWIVAAVVSLLLVTLGCSDSSSDSSDDRRPSASETAEALGTPDRATGPPVKVGYMTEGGSGALENQSELAEQGARIAADYLNEYRGGVAGHPLELVVCPNRATPAGARACANQFIDEGVAAVAWPFTGQPAIVPMLTEAGIPVVSYSGVSAEELTTPGAFTLTGGFPGAIAAYALDAGEQGYERFAMIVIDVPSATQGMEGLGRPVFERAGVELDVIAAPPGTPDLTSQLQQAVSGGADAVGVTGDVTFCTSFLRAYETLGLDLPMYVIAVCNDPSVISAMPQALDGARVATATAPSGADADLYAAMVGEYAPDSDIDPDPTRSTGIAIPVSAIMSFATAMDGLSGEVTAEAVRRQLETTDGELFLSGGIGFRCDGTAVPSLPSVCSAGAQIAELNGDGSTRSSTQVDPTSLFQS